MNKQIDIIQHLRLFNVKYKALGFQIVGLFGSYARKTQDTFSDIDLTYTMNHDIFHKDDAFAKLIALEEIRKELEQTFHQKVDLIPVNTKNKFLQQSLQEEQIII